MFANAGFGWHIETAVNALRIVLGGVFDHFAGATITPRGVVKAVKGGLDFFDKQRAQLLADTAPEKEKL